MCALLCGWVGCSSENGWARKVEFVLVSLLAHLFFPHLLCVLVLKSHKGVDCILFRLSKREQHVCRLHQHNLLMLAEAKSCRNIAPLRMMLVEVFVKAVILTVRLAAVGAARIDGTVGAIVRLTVRRGA